MIITNHLIILSLGIVVERRECRGMTPRIEQDLRREDVFREDQGVEVVHSHLDNAMEWCENSLLDLHLYEGEGDSNMLQNTNE